MKLVLQNTNPNSGFFCETIGITQERAAEIDKGFDVFLNDYAHHRVGQDGSLIKGHRASEIVEGFLDLAKEGNMNEMVYCLVHAGAHINESRSGEDCEIDLLQKIKNIVGDKNVKIMRLRADGIRKFPPEDDNITDF